MKAHLINTHLLLTRSRSSAKVKVKYKGYISQKKAVSGGIRVLQTHLVSFRYADTQKECEKKQSPSKRDIFYTASAVIQKDIPLQTQGRKTEERIDEG